MDCVLVWTTTLHIYYYSHEQVFSFQIAESIYLVAFRRRIRRNKSSCNDINNNNNNSSL